MDHHFRANILFFPYTDDGAEYVPDRGETKTAHDKILWDKMGGYTWIPGAFLLYFRWNHVFGKADPGKTCMVGKIEAAKWKLALSSSHSWFYPDLIGSPPGNPTGQAR